MLTLVEIEGIELRSTIPALIPAYIEMLANVEGLMENALCT